MSLSPQCDSSCRLFVKPSRQLAKTRLQDAFAHPLRTRVTAGPLCRHHLSVQVAECVAGVPHSPQTTAPPAYGRLGQ